MQACSCFLAQGQGSAGLLRRSGLIAGIKQVLSPAHLAAMQAWSRPSLAEPVSAASLACAAVEILHTPFTLPPQDDQLSHELQEVGRPC